MTRLAKTEEKNLYRAENGIYIWREKIAGRVYWRSTKTDKIGLARQRIKTFRATILGDGPMVRRKFSEAFDVVLKIQEAKSSKTFEMAKTQIGHLRPWFDLHCPFLGDFERAFEETWAKYKTDQASMTPGRKLIHDRRHLLMALKRAKEKGWIKRDFRKRDLQLLEASEPIGKIIPEPKIQALLSAADRNTPIGLQIRIGLLMGMRLREILHLRWSEIDFERGTISIRGQRVKTRVSRIVPIHAEVLPLLMGRKGEAVGDFVFPARFTSIEGKPVDPSQPQNDNSSPWDTVKKAAQAEYRFHDLRHTAISYMIQSGIPDLIISQITGASIAVIRRVYLHLNLDMTERVRNLRCGKVVV